MVLHTAMKHEIRSYLATSKLETYFFSKWGLTTRYTVNIYQSKTRSVRV
jgi:hypothetical protein